MSPFITGFATAPLSWNLGCFCITVGKTYESPHFILLQKNGLLDTLSRIMNPSHSQLLDLSSQTPNSCQGMNPAHSDHGPPLGRVRWQHPLQRIPQPRLRWQPSSQYPRSPNEFGTTRMSKHSVSCSQYGWRLCIWTGFTFEVKCLPLLRQFLLVNTTSNGKSRVALNIETLRLHPSYILCWLACFFLTYAVLPKCILSSSTSVVETNFYPSEAHRAY